MAADDLHEHIRDVPDFPKPGILFKDITPLLANPAALKEAVSLMGQPFQDHGITKIAAAEARGFLFGTALAAEMHVGFVPVRKPGKLPYSTISKSYDLEYGTDELHVHSDAFASGDRVLLVDDLLATGGTMGACIELVRECEAEPVGCTFLIELNGLGGRDKLDGLPSEAVLTYDLG